MNVKSVMKVLQCVLCLGAAVLAVGLGETAGAQRRKAFEVASIRALDQPYTRPPSSTVTPGRFEMTGANAKDVVARAFGIEWQQKSRIIAPDWADREPFEIRALMPNGATERDVPQMLKTLLEERFHFRFRIEQRPFPVYELVVLPLGSKLREVAAVDDLKKPFENPVGPAIFDSVTGLPGDEGDASKCRPSSRRQDGFDWHLRAQDGHAAPSSVPSYAGASWRSDRHGSIGRFSVSFSRGTWAEAEP